MTKFFGEPWPSQFCQDAEQAATPVGAICVWCSEAVADGDRGVIFSDGAAAHLACYIRSIFGGVNHQLGKCICCGGRSDPDPPGLTPREAAEAAFALWQRRSAAPLN